MDYKNKMEYPRSCKGKIPKIFLSPFNIDIRNLNSSLNDPAEDLTHIYISHWKTDADPLKSSVRVTCYLK